MNWKLWLPVALTIVYTGLLLSSGTFTKRIGFTVSESSYINQQFNYQIILLVVTGLSLITTFILAKDGFHTFFKLGDISANASEVKIFGIKDGDSWFNTGISLSVVITGVTTLFLYFQLKNGSIEFAQLTKVLPWIILFSLTNSFGEEMIYRLGLVAPLDGQLQPTTIFMISAVIFGLAHIGGVPSGIMGMSLAGLMGFVLAKSMHETHGFFWAWWIHFLQDVVIIGAMYLRSNSLN